MFSDFDLIKFSGDTKAANMQEWLQVLGPKPVYFIYTKDSHNIHPVLNFHY